MRSQPIQMVRIDAGRAREEMLEREEQLANRGVDRVLNGLQYHDELGGDDWAHNEPLLRRAAEELTGADGAPGVAPAAGRGGAPRGGMRGGRGRGGVPMGRGGAPMGYGGAASSSGDAGGDMRFESGLMRHIVYGEINKDGDPTGYHSKQLRGHDKTVMESTGKRTKKDKQGVYKQHVKTRGDGGKLKSKASSFFPDQMTPDQIQEAIDSARQVGGQLEVTRGEYAGMKLQKSGGTMYPVYSGAESYDYDSGEDSGDDERKERGGGGGKGRRGRRGR